MRGIKVHFNNGRTLTTSINGTPEEITAYYVGKEFNIGENGEDLMATAFWVEFLPNQAARDIAGEVYGKVFEVLEDYGLLLTASQANELAKEAERAVLAKLALIDGCCG